MATSYGYKRLVVGAGYGSMDWLAQRVTAVLMTLFTLIVIVHLLLPGELGYERWAGIFAAPWMKALTFVTIVAIGYHGWIGVRNVLMDYVKPVGTRLAIQVLAIVWLVGCGGWAVQVLWRL